MFHGPRTSTETHHHTGIPQARFQGFWTHWISMHLAQITKPHSKVLCHLSNHHLLGPEAHYAARNLYQILTHLWTCFTHQDHFRNPPACSLHCWEVDMTVQCSMLTGPQAMVNPLEFMWGCVWKHIVPSAPCVSFWEGGTCDRVTWSLGGIDSVSIL